MVFGDGQGRGCCGVYTRIPKECLVSLLLAPRFILKLQNRRTGGWERTSRTI